MSLPKRLQYQALADRLAGMAVEMRAEDFSGICRVCWEVMEERDHSGKVDEGVAEVIYRVTAEHPERFEFLEEMAKVRPGAGWPHTPSMEELYANLGEIEWIWKDWVPRGFISLLGAAAGVGKSLVALDLARRVMEVPSPQPSPGGRGSQGPGGRVVYVEAEGALQILRERARAWGMDLGRLFPFVPEGGEAVNLAEEGQRVQLGELCALVQPVLVVVDALSSACWTGLNNLGEVREVLMFLRDLAAEVAAGVLVVHHLRKPPVRMGREPLRCTIYDFSGSFYIVAMARVVMGLSVLGEEEGKQVRLLEVLKSNLGPIPEALWMEIGREEGGGVEVRWREAPSSTVGAGPSLPFGKGPSLPLEVGSSERKEEMSVREACMEWLVGVLGEKVEGMKVGEVIVRGKEAGFGRRMIFRARKALGGRVVNTRGRRHPGNGWRRGGRW